MNPISFSLRVDIATPSPGSSTDTTAARTPTTRPATTTTTNEGTRPDEA